MDREVRKSQEPQSLVPMESVTRRLQKPCSQGIEYEITLEGQESQEDRRAESPRLDDEREVNVDDFLEESQEREENQVDITLE